MEIVNRAVLEIGLSVDPFPDLSKVLLACERIRRTNAGTMPQGELTVSKQTVETVAAKLGLNVSAAATPVKRPERDPLKIKATAGWLRDIVKRPRATSTEPGATIEQQQDRKTEQLATLRGMK